MAITINHSKVSTIPDGDDDSLIRPSDWNADHTIDGVIGVENGGTGDSSLTDNAILIGAGTDPIATDANFVKVGPDVGLGTDTPNTYGGYSTITIGGLPSATAGEIDLVTEDGLAHSEMYKQGDTLVIDNYGVTAGNITINPIDGVTTLSGDGVDIQGTLKTESLTGYLYGNSTTGVVTASTSIPNANVSGLGTAALLDAGVANGVATLDSGGQVPLSQIPPLGDLNYQGTWNATTNTPTLVSSTGTKGYYYVVSVAGSTNLNGITDWKVGDWAVFNGSVWEKIDNTDAVTSVNGYTGTVVLTYSDVGAANAGTNTNITSMTGITGGISTADYVEFDTTYATTLTAGQLGWDGNNTLGLGMIGGNVIQHIGEDQFFYAKASSTISKGQVIMFTGAVGASGVPTGAPATGITDGTYIMGIAAEAIATNGFGLIQCFGTLRNINTSGYADGDILWYNPAVTGGLTKTKPSAPNVKVQMAAVINGGSSGGGTILIRIDPGSTLGGTDSNAQITSPANGNLLTYDGAGAYWKNTDLTAGTGISVSKASDGTLTVTNTSPSSGGTVTSVNLTAGTGMSVSGGPITSSGSITVTNTAPDQTVTMTSGTGISVTGTYPNFTVTNTSPSSGGTVTSITAGTGLTGGTITSSGTIAIDSTVTTNSGSQTLTNKTISGSSNTLSNIGNSSLTNSSITINGSAISLGGSVSVGTVTSVTGTAPISSSGGATPAISISQASDSTNGYLSSTDWTTFNNKAAPFTYTSTYIPYGQGTTTPNQSSTFTYDGTTVTAPIQRASNGIICNNRTISASFSIPSGDSAMSTGPITIASGVTVTVPSGGKWVVL